MKERKVLGSFPFDWLSGGLKDFLHPKSANNEIK